MKCPHCGERFEANWRTSGPGGYEAPGTFLLLGAAFAGLTCAAVKWNWGGTAVAVAGIATVFTWVQVPGEWLNCRGSGCPKCGKSVRVWFWSR